MKTAFGAASRRAVVDHRDHVYKQGGERTQGAARTHAGYNFKYKSVSDFYGLLAEFLARGGTLNDAEDYLKTVSCLDDYNSIRVVEEFRKKILN